jgi:hypothetical protein
LLFCFISLKRGDDKRSSVHVTQQGRLTNRFLVDRRASNLPKRRGGKSKHERSAGGSRTFDVRGVGWVGCGLLFLP